MHYKMEELIPLTAKLAEQYSSFESSSVTYETAQMLMEAVLYCIHECFETDILVPSPLDEQIPAAQAYQTGYERVLERARDAKRLYETLVQDLETFGCVNYRSTILEGMPSFFLYYDARFQPQNHILTLDYPVIARLDHLRGVERIHSYLSSTLKEKVVLGYFDSSRIERLLENSMPDGREYFMDNICESVLFQAVCCVIADREVGELVLEELDYKVVSEYVKEDSIERAEVKVQGILRLILKQMGNQVKDMCEDYFHALGRDFAVRMQCLK